MPSGTTPTEPPTPMGVGLAVAAGVLVLDQATKWWIVEVVMVPPREIPVLPVFNLVLGWNRGISFGLFNWDSDLGAWLFTGLALAIVCVLVAWMRRAEGRWMAATLGLIVGGALGNVIDRLRYGAVADFLDFHLAGYHWPAFNVADAGIAVGAAVLILESLFAGPKRHNKGGGEKTGKRS